jgi:hypothetical protein
MPNGEKPPHVREKAVQALLSCATIKQAAKKAGVGVRTIKLWLHQDQAFRQMLAEARRKALELAVSRMARATTGAVTALTKATRQGNIKAAAIIIDRAIKGIELVDLAERMEEVEKILERRGLKS